MRDAHRSRAGRLSALALASLAVLCLAPSARAQFNGIPFDPYSAAYRSSSLPSPNQMAPGQARRVVPPGMGNVPGIGTPFDSAFTTPSMPPRSRFERDLGFNSPSNDVYRRYDEQFGRVYRPNAEADDKFAQVQQARQQIYFEAMNETDPERKAELMKQYRDLSRRISLGMSPSSGSGAVSARAGQADSSARGPGGLPRTVRSYDDLVQWSRAINRDALAAGIVVPDPD